MMWKDSTLETAEDQVPQFAKGHAAPPGKAPAAEPTVGSISSPWISRPTMRNPRRSRALGRGAGYRTSPRKDRDSPLTGNRRRGLAVRTAP